jgi:hypothetical protein
MNAAIARRAHDDDSSFVGQILLRRTPTLTWRPAVVERLEREAKTPSGEREREGDEARIPMASSVRLTSSSKLPTRRVPAWPVVAKLAHHSRLSPRGVTILRAAVALVVGCSLGVLVLSAMRPLLDRSLPAQALASGTAAASSSAPAAAHVATTFKAVTLHVSGDPVDSLAVPEAPVVEAPGPKPVAAAPKAKPAATPVHKTALHATAHAPRPARANARPHAHR